MHFVKGLCVSYYYYFFTFLSMRKCQLFHFSLKLISCDSIEQHFTTIFSRVLFWVDLTYNNDVKKTS